MLKAIGLAFATILVGMTIIGTLVEVHNRRSCADLGVEIEVFQNCSPGMGCMASLTEQTDLVKKVLRCQKAIGDTRELKIR